LELVAARLRLPTKLVQDIHQTGQLRALLPELSEQKPSTVTAALEAMEPLVITAVYQSTSDAALREPLRAYMLRYRHIRPTVNGDDLRAMGLPPSPNYRRILQSLRQAWLDGQVSTPQQEQALLQALIAENYDGNS